MANWWLEISVLEMHRKMYDTQLPARGPNIVMILQSFSVPGKPDHA